MLRKLYPLSYTLFLTPILFSPAQCRYLELTNRTDAEPLMLTANLRDDTVCSETGDWLAKPFEPFRLKWIISDLSGLSDDSQTVIKDMMEELRKYHFKLLKVRRFSGPIGVPSTAACYGAARFPEHVIDSNRSCDDESTNGVFDVDYLVYVTAMGHLHCEESILGWAQNCVDSPFDKRPIVGIVNLCPQRVNTANWNRLSLFSLIRHEMFHALGFTWDLYSRMIFTVDGENKSMLEYIRRDWKVNPSYRATHLAQTFVAPRVKAFVRKHFNCSTLEGAELENDGESGTQGTHFEKRVFGPEVMTGFISRITYVSNMTLGLLEDLQWYRANYRYTQTYKFGEQKGCTFAKQSCREYIDSKEDEPGAAKPFCNWADFVEKKKYKSTARECSQDKDYYSSCDWEERPANYSMQPDHQYFLDKWAVVNEKLVNGSRLEGYTSSNDGCAIWLELLYKEGDLQGRRRVGDSVCDNAFSQPPAQANWGAEIYGTKSMCFEQDGKFEVYECLTLGLTKYNTEMAHGAGCYEYKCQDGRLMVRANYSIEDDDRKKKYMQAFKVCWGAGMTISIRRHQRSGPGYGQRYHKGVIVCPSCKEVCEGKQEWEGGNFKCKQDYRINSTDYGVVPCRQGARKVAENNAFSLLMLCLYVAYSLGTKAVRSAIARNGLLRDCLP